MHELNTITPYFTVENGDQLIEFVQHVFGGILIKENRYENGCIQHARLAIGNSVMMLNESTESYQTNASQIHLYVEDVKLTYETALEQGATLVQFSQFAIGKYVG